MSAPTASHPATDGNRQRTVLVIDDEAPIRENLIRFLRLEGYRVIDAADGAAGLAAALQHSPDLILCDVMMPRMTGFEVLAALQATDTHRHIPLVFLSASAEPEKLEEGLSKGARNYVTKPFNLAILQRVIQQSLTDISPSTPQGTGPSA